MDPVATVTGSAIPLAQADVDTDQIIPARHLKRIERTGYGEFAFEYWRKNDPDFVVNRPEYQNASILLAGSNFGCGSSREHAVWALQQMGLRAIVGTSFADIFRNNSAKMGLLLASLEPADIDYLMKRTQDTPDAQITVDLSTQSVSIPGDWQRSFDIDPFVKHCLLNGLDDIGLTLQHEDSIAAFETQRPALLPRTKS